MHICYTFNIAVTHLLIWLKKVWVDLEKIWVDLGKIDLVRVDLVRVDFERVDFERVDLERLNWIWETKLQDGEALTWSVWRLCQWGGSLLTICREPHWTRGSKKVEVVNGTYILLIKWTPWHLFVTAISGGRHWYKVILKLSAKGGEGFWADLWTILLRQEKWLHYIWMFSPPLLFPQVTLLTLKNIPYFTLRLIHISGNPSSYQVKPYPVEFELLFFTFSLSLK